MHFLLWQAAKPSGDKCHPENSIRLIRLIRCFFTSSRNPFNQLRNQRTQRICENPCNLWESTLSKWIPWEVLFAWLVHFLLWQAAKPSGDKCTP